MQFNFGKKVVEQKVTRETVIPEPSYNLPIALAGKLVFILSVSFDVCLSNMIILSVIRH